MQKTRTCRRAFFLAIAGIVAIGAVGTLRAQEPAADTKPSAFEVASVKPNNSGRFALMGGGIRPGDRVTFINMPLDALIREAYSDAYQTDHLVGGPDWMANDRFDISAKADAQVPADQLREMLRTLLADRFHLRVHAETRDEPIYALVFARSDHRLGPNLRPAATDCAAIRAGAAHSGDPDPCGIRTFANALRTGRMSVRGLRLDQFFGLLSRDAGRKVVNKTELTGVFDCDLSWTPRTFIQAPFNQERFPSIDPNGPSIFTAVQEQLGLKLESTKGPVDILVIDHVEQPSED
jgi:uncharacterized protein (TIGR03435 family)